MPSSEGAERSDDRRVRGARRRVRVPTPQERHALVQRSRSAGRCGDIRVRSVGPTASEDARQRDRGIHVWLVTPLRVAADKARPRRRMTRADVRRPCDGVLHPPPRVHRRRCGGPEDEGDRRLPRSSHEAARAMNDREVARVQDGACRQGRGCAGRSMPVWSTTTDWRDAAERGATPCTSSRGAAFDDLERADESTTTHVTVRQYDARHSLAHKEATK